MNLKCLFRKHKFTNSINRCLQLEVKGCENCEKVLNINHMEGLSFVSNRRFSLIKDIEYMNKLLKSLKEKQ